MNADMSVIKRLLSTHESTNERVREDTQRKLATRVSWIQKRILNDQLCLMSKPTEGEVPI